MEKSTLKKIHKIKNRLLEILPEIQAIYLFGSTLVDNDFPKKDIDLALLLPFPLDSHKLFEIKIDLESDIGRDLDIIELKKASEVFRALIISSGSIIYESENARNEIEAFENRVYQSYIYLKENIKPILESIESSGEIYSRV